MTGAPTEMPISIISWKASRKNTLRGFASVRLGGSLVINDVTVHNKDGKRWASFPSKPLLDAEGTPKRDDRGKVQYVPVLNWADRDSGDRFSASVIAALEREFPGATEA